MAGLRTSIGSDAVVKPLPRLRLQGFNNLTKSLSFNIYDVCYAASEDERRRYIEYIDEEYNADRLTTILTDVAEIIGANILNVARQDYDPQGASVTILISEQPVIDKADAKGVISTRWSPTSTSRTSPCTPIRKPIRTTASPPSAPTSTSRPVA